MIDNVKINESIVDKMNNKSGIFTSSFYILFFISKESGELLAYDTRDPIRACRDIMNKNENYEYLSIESYHNEATVREICKCFRVVREAKSKLLPLSETTEIVVRPRTTALSIVNV